MEIRQELLEGVPVIRVAGDLDHAGAPALEKAFRVHLSAGNHRMLLDLAECGYVDSGGLAALIMMAGQLRDDGLLAIVAPNVSVRRLLDVVGLYEHRRCAIFKGEPEALSSLIASPGVSYP